jgi:hypothetical protein
MKNSNLISSICFWLVDKYSGTSNKVNYKSQLAVRQNTSYYQQRAEKMRNTNSSLERA